MARSLSSRALPDAFAADEAPPGGEPVPPAPEDERPVVIFLVPGIRSSATWAQTMRLRSTSFASRPVRVYVVTGRHHLGLLDLLLRHRLRSFREDVLHQVGDRVAGHPGADVNLLCHSMGAAILADVAGGVAAAVARTPGARLRHVVFIGSVCHRAHARAIARGCERFLNEVGQRDLWSWAASVANPVKYGDTGQRGFNNAWTEDRFHPEGDHFSPTEPDWISRWVMPVFEEGRIAATVTAVTAPGFTALRYAKYAIWLAAALALALGAALAALP